MIQPEPGFIVGPITWLLGLIFNIVFNVVITMTEVQALGITIIIVTIIARFLMYPLTMKSQQSMMKMQMLTPEVEKIKAKYPDKSDRDGQMKMNQEIQKLYSENKVNPLGGCLPILLQFPIFIALNYLMNNTYLYVSKIGDIYREIATSIMSIPDYTNELALIAAPMRPKGMELNISSVEGVEKVVNKMSEADWARIYEIAPNLQDTFQPLLEQKEVIETFMGVNLTVASGWGFPGILIPVLAGLLTFLTSYISMKGSGQSSDPNAQASMKVMMYVMPVMIVWMTASLSAGVGVYWITSSAFQVIQQLRMNKQKQALMTADNTK